MAATFYWTIRYGSSASTKVVGSNHTATGTETKESGAGAGGALDRVDFLSLDTGETSGGLGGDSNRINYASFAIRAGENSMERWVRGKWDFQAGVTNQITGVYFWLSSGSNAVGAVNFYGKITGTYTTPATGTTIIGANSTNWTSATGSVSNLVPTGTAASPPADAWPVTFSGDQTQTLTSGTTTGGYSNYIVLQLRTTTSASPGNTNGGNPYQFTIQYDES